MILEGKSGLADKLKNLAKTYLNKAKGKIEIAIQKAVDKKKEQLRLELEKKLEEIKQKILDSINL